MALMDIVIYGDPVLRRIADDVVEFDDKLAKLADDMIETMKNTDDGVGLAAPQVGASIRMVVLGYPTDEDNNPLETHVLVNPEVIEESDELEEITEGCLSLPDIQADVTRPTEITLKYQNLKGEELFVEAKGFIARLIQHEMDHIDGTLILDHMPALKRSLLKGRLKRMQKETVEKMKKNRS
jgi:peptide deformylase